MDNRNKTEQPDGVFREKLKNYKVSVSPGVWDRINKEKHAAVKPVWQTVWFWTAASIGGLLLAGGVWIGLRPELTDEQISVTGASQNHIPSPETNLSDADHLYSGESTEQKQHLSDVEAAPTDLPTRKSIVPSSYLKEETHKQTIAGKIETASTLPGPEAPVVEPREIQPVKGTQPVIADTGVAKAGDGSGQVETRVLVVYVTPPAEPEQESVAEEVAVAENDVILTEHREKERKGIRRLFRQLKNAKTGEKIDWEELGINPQKVFANVDHIQE